MGIGRAECAPRMAPRSLERHAVTVRPDAAVDEALGLASIDRDHRVDLGTAIPEQVLDPPQITEAFLARVADEKNVGLGGDGRLLERPQDAEQHHQPARVVADSGCDVAIALDPDRDVGFRGKDRVEMRDQGDDLPATAPRPAADDVSGVVRRHVGKTRIGQHRGEAFAARPFAERRRRDLRKFDEIVEKFPFHRDQVLQRGTNSRPIRECVDRITAVGNDRGGHHHQSRQQETQRWSHRRSMAHVSGRLLRLK